VKNKMSQDEYRQKVFALINLPTLPVIATEILRIIHEDKLSVNQMLPIIERDPPLAMKILKFANSSYYGLQEKVRSLRHAMVVIGMRQLSELSMAFSVIKIFDQGDGQRNLPWKSFWEHSAACGHIAQLLVEMLNIRIVNSPYSLGLLHDIGKLVMYRVNSLEYADAYNFAIREKCTSYVAEKEVIGLTHAEVGMWIAERWELPRSLITGIGYHHEPSQVAEPDLALSTALTQLADLVCNFNSIMFGTGYVRSIPRDEEGWAIIKNQCNLMDDLDFEHFVMSIEDEISTINEMIKIVRN